MNLIRSLFATMCLLSLPGCVKLTLAWADVDAEGAAAAPPLAQPVDPESWRTAGRPDALDGLSRYVYGRMPSTSATEILERKIVNEAAFGGRGALEEYRLRGNASFNGVDNATSEFIMNVVYPVGVENPPVILMQTFCPRWDTIPHPEIVRPPGAGSCNDGFASGVMRYVFGRYIATPPIVQILERGYAVATIYPGEFVPDRKDKGLAALASLSAGHEDDETRWGAVAAWAWGFSRMVDALHQDGRLEVVKSIAFGHSRYGKSALVAAAWDERISGVIAHQSGTGGASLSKFKKGESIGEITQSYPHWFSDVYSDYAGRESELPVDQHHLLAAIAPRPVLLGNARRDVWSDPAGSFRAAKAADPVYEALGVAGLRQERLDEFIPDADLSFWIRPGTHGVVEEDWPAFLEFLDAHFKESDGS